VPPNTRRLEESRSSHREALRCAGPQRRRRRVQSRRRVDERVEKVWLVFMGLYVAVPWSAARFVVD
jgi:hypothetical protein